MANTFFKDGRGRHNNRANVGRKKIPEEERKVQVAFYVRAKNADAFKAAGGELLKQIDGG